MRGGKWRDVFGEIKAISETGRYVMMERLLDLSAEEYRRTQSYPDWLRDLKPENIGRAADGKFKVRDYAMTKLGDLFDLSGTYRYSWQGRERAVGTHPKAYAVVTYRSISDTVSTSE